MILSRSGVSRKAGNSFSIRRIVAPLGGLLALTALVFAGTRADAQVHFHYNGGSWSHHWHAGWHRYWGGPSIGFYYAPEPVYVVPGYADPYYYTGPTFWYSNPSFGLSLNFGGGWGGGYYGGGYHGGHYYGGHGGSFHASGGHFGGHGGSFHASGGHFGGHGGSFHASGGHFGGHGGSFHGGGHHR